MALGRWRWGDETFIQKHNANLVHFEKGRVFIKERAKESVEKFPEAVWDEYLNTQGTNELKDIFGGKSFSFPKPINLIKQLLKISNTGIVLDFFAGSGTTLHAVMQLNAEDGGKRQCILCTNNENGICENVTYERNKRVIKGYTKPNGDAVEGLHDNNLRYYRTDFVSRERSQKNRHKLMDKSTDLLCIKEDIYTERREFGNISLNPRGARFFAKDGRRMLVIYRPELIPHFVDEIEAMDVSEPIMVYVYAPDRYAYDDEFAAVTDKVWLCALPQNIIEAMARVMPEKTANESNSEGKTESDTATASGTYTHDDDSLFPNLEVAEL